MFDKPTCAITSAYVWRHYERLTSAYGTVAASKPY